MSDPVTTITARLGPVVSGIAAEIAGEDQGDVDPVVRPSDRADAQINGALALAKRLGADPRDLARRIVESGALDEIATELEVAGPGFVNVTFDPRFLERELASVAADPGLGLDRVDEPLTVVVDYSAPNVAKEMHVGHLRSTAIGDSLVRMLEARGHRVKRENHIGDWGTPFGMLIEHLVDLGETEAADSLSLGDLNGFYKQARGKFDASEEFRERSRQRVVALQGGDGETLRLWRLLVALSAAYFRTVYDRMGVLLTDDDLVGESHYQPLMPGVVERLDAAGLLVESDGADVVFPPGFENRDGDPLPLIVQKGTGGFNYATSDLACLIERTEDIGADLVLYVVDAGQSQHFQMVFAVAEMAGWLDDSTEAVHVPFGIVLGPDRKRLKTRSGEPVRLVALLDEAVERAESAVLERNPDLEPAARSAVATAIGIGAVKYADLSTDRVKDYVFDFDRMLAFEGDTGPYLQYAHARICSIFRRAGVDRATVRTAPITLTERSELALARLVLAHPTAVEAALDTFSPHKLCTWLHELATAFSAFYEHCPILGSDEAVRTSRLALADLTARVLERSLAMLGIAAPERM
ncbi:arginine--tRNA ligase [Ilumatobacter sp.]|uniref:arginine--tRNA ligase n=1 Tax=Ilumatobacter sp. TaxID=1967498 RepID=UPI003B526659